MGHEGHDHEHHDHPGHFHERASQGAKKRDFSRRAFTVGIGGPVGSGKTALVLALCKHLRTTKLGVVTNDIFTREDAEFLWRTRLDVRKCGLIVDLGVTREFAAVDVDADYAGVDYEAAVADRPGLKDAAPGGELDWDSSLGENRRVFGRKTIERWRQACQWRLLYPSAAIPLRHIRTIPLGLSHRTAN